MFFSERLAGDLSDVIQDLFFPPPPASFLPPLVTSWTCCRPSGWSEASTWNTEVKPASNSERLQLIGYLRVPSLPLFSFFVVGLNPLPGPRGEWTSLFNIFRPTSPAEGGSCRAASSIKPPAGRSLWRNSRRFGGNFAESSDWRKLGGKFWTQTALFF